jgi:hypothetical protein
MYSVVCPLIVEVCHISISLFQENNFYLLGEQNKTRVYTSTQILCHFVGRGGGGYLTKLSVSGLHRVGN